jgi:hypothetical protein
MRAQVILGMISFGYTWKGGEVYLQAALLVQGLKSHVLFDTLV